MSALSNDGWLVDMHLHSNEPASDGELSVDELVAAVSTAADERGIPPERVLFALTDHNTTSGLAEAAELAAERGFHFVPGCEVMVYDEQLDECVEILVYSPSGCLEPLETLCSLSTARLAVRRRIERTLQLWMERGRFSDELPLEMDSSKFAEIKAAEYENDYRFFTMEIAPLAAPFPPTRRGLVEIFYSTLRNKKSPLHVPAADCRFPTCSELLRECAGSDIIAVLAHPGEYEIKKSELFELLERLVSNGMKGVEAYSPKNPGALALELADFAAERSIFATGGSDVHSKDDTWRIGFRAETAPIPREVANPFVVK